MLTPSHTLPWTIDLNEAGSDELIDPTSLQAEPEAHLWDGEAWLQSISDQEEARCWSDRAEQVEWEERLQELPTLCHTCTSCHYFNRDYRPALPCALHPRGIDVAVHEFNSCSDWQALDLAPVLATLEQTLAQHPTTCGKDWTIERLVYPPGQSLQAVVQINEVRHHWRWQWQRRWVWRGECWRSLGAIEQFRVWCHPSSPSRGGQAMDEQ